MSKNSAKFCDKLCLEIEIGFGYHRVILKTIVGRVCIPIDPNKAEQFDPMSVPTITQLTSEIDKFAQEEKEKNVSKDYKKTSLREPVKIFEEFLSKLGETWRGKLIESSDAQMNF